jgi:hypothetical protein
MGMRLQTEIEVERLKELSDRMHSGSILKEEHM